MSPIKAIGDKKQIEAAESVAKEGYRRQKKEMKAAESVAKEGYRRQKTGGSC
ncbi:hypothetical protein [Neobacillus niacini]|uniref:hypothetical protein n=1 Tax=Neobacillus niacini TaxID=86668 RepID=UPI0028669EED|nr:hypothetical protein [Neobacillus niacini]MDR6999564.1 uncharacterized protein YdaT [Neobacillus niacini]